MQEERKQHHAGRASTETQRQLEREIDKYVSKQEAMVELERQLAERENVLKQKEEALEEMSKFELKRLRASANLRESIADLGAQLEAAQGELASQEPLSGSSTAKELGQQIKRLQNDRNALQRQQEVIRDAFPHRISFFCIVQRHLQSLNCDILLC